MAMKNKILAFFQKKIEAYLPSEEPETEAERLYEEGKQKVYALHMDESDLFYVDSIWKEEERIHVYGEFARGDFSIGEKVEFLDNYADHLLYGLVERLVEDMPKSVNVKKGILKTTPKIYLVIASEDGENCGESFVHTNFLVKKKESQS